MGIATEHAPTPSGGMKPYTLWEIDVRLFNDAMIEIEKLSCRQDLWVGEGQFVVRLTPLGENNYSPYEDRGSVDERGVIKRLSVTQCGIAARRRAGWEDAASRQQGRAQRRICAQSSPPSD